MHLITLNQAKMLKSTGKGYLSGCLNLAPAYNYRGHNTCPYAGQCKASCLQYCGRNGMSMARLARERKTMLFYDDLDTFRYMLFADLAALRAKAKREDVVPTFRFNCLSDISIEDYLPDMFSAFPEIQFIDYTKVYSRMFKELPDNYHLTYSINEKTPAGIINKIYSNTRFNCAAVFEKPVPSRYKFDGKLYPVISGDESDLRHLDPRQAIVGLKYKNPMHNKKLKGKALKPGFIILNN
jgi:hypothetical protein